MDSRGDGATVLIVDDEPFNVDLLEQELDAGGYRTLAAANGEEALALAAQHRPALVLLDVMMKPIDGYETCRRLKDNPATRAIPVIFLTALGDTFQKVRAFGLGAVDYITKPFETEELLARVGVHIALRREIDAHGKARATINLLVEEIRDHHSSMVGDSAALKNLRAQIAQVAPTDSTVLIQGETGTGKELVARAIHAGSRRRERPLVKVNCAALPRDLVESELFGHEKGAFTGAVQQRRGRFELADGGTLFLDEIGDMPLDAQAKLLRVLQEREFERVGGTRVLRTDVRVIAATNRDVRAHLSSGAFRADLFYRLNVFPLAIPPLRERREDIPQLIRHFAAKSARKLGRPVPELTPALLERGMSYDWPGNIRELENFVERALIMAGDGVLDAIDMLAAPAVAAPATTTRPRLDTLEAMEREHIRRTLAATGWQIEGEAGAAHLLGINPSTLRGRMRKLGIRKSA
jgi:DNA-binding NtrC family response regulator